MSILTSLPGLLALAAAWLVVTPLLPTETPGVLLALEPVTTAALIGGGANLLGGLFGGDDGGSSRAAQIRAQLAERALGQAERAFQQRAPLRNMGLGALGQFFAGQQQPTAFSGQRPGPQADTFGLLGQMFQGRTRPQPGSTLFPGFEPQGGRDRRSSQGGGFRSSEAIRRDFRSGGPGGTRNEDLPADELERIREEVMG